MLQSGPYRSAALLCMASSLLLLNMLGIKVVRRSWLVVAGLIYFYICLCFDFDDHFPISSPLFIGATATKVGNVAVGMCIFSLFPFFIMIFSPKGYAHPKNLFDLPSGGWKTVKWSGFLNRLFWTLNYWDSASSFAGDVDDGSRIFPLAMGICVALVVITTAMPVVVGVAVEADPDYSCWEDGYLATAATHIAGRWFGIWVAAGAAVSNIGMFEAELSSDSLQVMGMAHRGMLPRVLGKTNRYNTPTSAILLSGIGMCSLAFLDLAELVEILNQLYVFAQFLEFAAFMKLRWTYPDVHRSWHIPFGLVGCGIMLLPATFFLIILLCM